MHAISASAQTTRDSHRLKMPTCKGICVAQYWAVGIKKASWKLPLA